MKRDSNNEQLGQVIERLLKAYGLDERMSQLDAINSWERIMGAAVARYTREITIRNGVLTLRLTSSVLREELAFGKEKIIAIMNREAGREIVKEVRLL